MNLRSFHMYPNIERWEEGAPWLNLNWVLVLSRPIGADFVDYLPVAERNVGSVNPLRVIFAQKFNKRIHRRCFSAVIRTDEDGFFVGKLDLTLF